MNDFRLFMTDLFLKNILYYKQFDIIEKLASWEWIKKNQALLMRICGFKTPKPDISSFKAFNFGNSPVLS